MKSSKRSHTHNDFVDYDVEEDSENPGILDYFQSIQTNIEDNGFSALMINNAENGQDMTECPWHLRIMMGILGIRLASVTGFMVMESLMAVSIARKTSLTLFHFVSFLLLISVYVSMITAFSYYSWMLLESALIGRIQIGITLFALLLCILTIPSVPWF
mmetsp:Transcript_1598/g.2198  ORF Transcript_1598/g.2198 Transcript_1598/m.2198 type:complete len:159 (-) Transcript_1598:170-646(-)